MKESNRRTDLGSTPLLSTTVLEDSQDFAALEEEWEDLYRNSPLATPFQSWAWLYSWWEAYGEGYELRLVTIREAGLLVGLMPLMLERRRGFGRLLLIGTGLTDHLDILARKGWETQVAEASGRVLRQIDSWHVADFQELRPTAVAWSIPGNWTGPHTRVQQSNCVEIEVETWEELLKSRSKDVREKTRKTIRRVKEDGVRCELASQDGVEQASWSWLALHREYWRGRGINPEHLTRRFGSHTVAAAQRMSASGFGGIYEFRRGEEVIASDFVLVGHEYVASYLHGANEYACGRFQISALFMWNWVNVALEHGVPAVSMLRGEERYKLRWNPKIIPNQRLILGQKPASFALYAAYYLLCSKAAEHAELEDAPAWVKSAVDRLKRFLPL